ncbi:uncharacterized protein TNCV_4686401 [Trichonephila clavipes]|nr:uncharacterized protein TNCV_4686401 [Trichonephila clavipes]
MFGTSLYRYHNATYPHASDSVNRRTNDTIFVSSCVSLGVASSCVTALELRHLCETALLSHGLFASVFDGLVAFAVERWRHDCCARRVRFFCPTRVTNEGRKIRFVYLPFRT